MGPAKRSATYEDLLAVPDHLVAEIVAGTLHTSPRPASPHAHAASTLGMDIGTPFHRGRGGPGGWWILHEPELHLGADVLVPDRAGGRRERMPVVPDTAWFELAPDWVCEVVSPSTGRLDRTVKMPAYAREGVAFAWLVDPLQRTPEVFGLREGQWVLLAAHAEDERVRVEPFEAVELELGALWLSREGEGEVASLRRTAWRHAIRRPTAKNVLCSDAPADVGSDLKRALALVSVARG